MPSVALGRGPLVLPAEVALRGRQESEFRIQKNATGETPLDVVRRLPLADRSSIELLENAMNAKANEDAN